MLKYKLDKVIKKSDDYYHQTVKLSQVAAATGALSAGAKAFQFLNRLFLTGLAVNTATRAHDMIAASGVKDIIENLLKNMKDYSKSYGFGEDQVIANEIISNLEKIYNPTEASKDSKYKSLQDKVEEATQMGKDKDPNAKDYLSAAFGEYLQDAGYVLANIDIIKLYVERHKNILGKGLDLLKDIGFTSRLTDSDKIIFDIDRLVPELSSLTSKVSQMKMELDSAKPLPESSKPVSTPSEMIEPTSSEAESSYGLDPNAGLVGTTSASGLDDQLSNIGLAVS